jgi:hypothetical protein
MLAQRDKSSLLTVAALAVADSSTTAKDVRKACLA